MISAVKGKVSIPTPVCFGIIGGGLCIVLTVGLLTGLVGRPNSKLS